KPLFEYGTKLERPTTGMDKTTLITKDESASGVYHFEFQKQLKTDKYSIRYSLQSPDFHNYLLELGSFKAFILNEQGRVFASNTSQFSEEELGGLISRLEEENVKAY